jgi:hypothetical protein
MKKIILAAAVLLIHTGCSKFNDAGPLENLTESYVFDPTDKNGFYAEQYLNDVYSGLPNGFNRIDGNLLDAATDDAVPSQDGTDVDQLTKGFISISSNPDDAWTKNYAGIRKVNLFLAKIDVVPVPAKIVFWKPEARFLRALFYFELVKRYGGVPLVGDRVLNTDAPENFKRNSFEECINYIVSECDAIKPLVKTEPLATAGDYGKPTTSVVMALKARALLYAASPLYNGGNIGATTEQKSVQGYASFDAERWNKAAQAANDIILLGKFSLEATYNNVFITRKNNEVMLAFLRGVTSDLEQNNGPVGYGSPANGRGRTSPTQNLVDAFPTNTGKDINDATSGYNAATPYANRDARMQSTVLFNGTRWLNRPLETFEGGLDKPNVNTTQTKTGYYLRKFLGDFTTATQYANQNHNFPIFRYADVLLSYAEALNEYSGPSANVYNQLVALRRRAGIVKGAGVYGYGLKDGMTKDEMRIAIRNERRIEMAFEEQRYWDVRRWKIAEQVFNTNLQGVKINRDAAGTFSYQKVNVAPLTFTAPRMYFYPIPFSEISKNTNLIQNTGW